MSEVHERIDSHDLFCGKIPTYEYDEILAFLPHGISSGKNFIRHRESHHLIFRIKIIYGSEILENTKLIFNNNHWTIF
jgi:hypothetical protein